MGNTIDRELIDGLLKTQNVEVIFKKSDGSERRMKCTLKPDSITPYEKKTDRVKQQDEDVVSVWDLDADAWRSFRMSSVIGINVNI